MLDTVGLIIGNGFWPVKNLTASVLRVFIGRCGNAFGSIGAESVCYICRHLVISHIATIVQVYHACGQNFAHFCFCLIFRRNSRQASALTRERGTHHPR